MNTFKILEEHGNPKLAIKYAEKILKDHGSKIPSNCKPGTRVHLLVKQLAQYLPPEYKTLYID